MTVRISNANLYGALSEGKLSEFEKRFHIHLPNDYREFLFQYNGGQPVPSFFWIEPKQDGSTLHRFYGIYEGEIPSSIETYLRGKGHYGIPASMLPIGDDGTGNFICIGVSAANFGNIFFLDHEKHPFHDPDSIEGIIKLRNSFTEFLASLIESPS